MILINFVFFFFVNFNEYCDFGEFYDFNTIKTNKFSFIETTDAVKRRMAVQTHETNLKDKLFCELFPGIAEKSRNFLSRAKSLNNRQKNANSSSQGSSEDDPYESSLRQLENNEIQAGQGFYGAVTNFLVIGGFAAFAFVVQYVIQSLTVTD